MSHYRIVSTVACLSRNEIIESHSHLVRPIALSLKHRLPASFEADDLIQSGMIGLIAAADRYDETRPETFEAYCRQKIRGAILDACKHEYRNATCESIDDNVYQLRAPAPRIDEQLEQEQAHDQVRNAIENLTPRQRKVVSIRFASDRTCTQVEAGEQLGGISQAGVRDLEQRAFRSMQRQLSNVIMFPKPVTRPAAKAA